MLRIKAKRINESKVKGYSSNTDFISRVKGVCFPFCFPFCFQRVGKGNIKTSNESKLKSKQENEVKIKIKTSNEQKLKAKKENL